MGFMVGSENASPLNGGDVGELEEFGGSMVSGDMCALSLEYLRGGSLCIHFVSLPPTFN